MRASETKRSLCRLGFTCCSPVLAALSRVKTWLCSPLTNSSAFRRVLCEQLLSRDEVVACSRRRTLHATGPTSVNCASSGIYCYAVLCRCRTSRWQATNQALRHATASDKLLSAHTPTKQTDYATVGTTSCQFLDGIAARYWVTGGKTDLADPCTTGIQPGATA